ncbi:hypothetical protein F5Y14DRAFT_425597 [Nemania sp. NC0429]|nr:hypothetical protein F5Y14DRAFT_425597 [Nemania sp. NC0429]
MPPKRKQRDEIISDGEPDVVLVPPRGPNIAALLPEVMQNIETLKFKRDSGRKKITAGFRAYLDEVRNEIKEYYASEAKKRSAEVSTLLTRYAETLEKQASIEKSIEEIVRNSRDDLRELTMVLKAAYSGRQQQSAAATGSFASIIESVPVKTCPAGPPSPGGNGALNMQSKAWTSKASMERYALDGNSTNVRDSKHRNEQQGGSVFDQITW